jgi:hypothetical protein
VSDDELLDRLVAAAVEPGDPPSLLRVTATETPGSD